MLISVTNNTKRKKRKKIRHAEYYDMQEKLDELYALSKKGHNFNKLMDIITSEENIKMAYRNIKSNDGSTTAGTDGKTIKHLSKISEEKYITIIKSKLNWYVPKTVRRVEIPKPNGKKRPLGIPTIWDRLVQQCILQVLEPICEAKFHERNNGFRPNRSVEHAMAQCYKMIHHYHLSYVVDIDIKGFFDNVNHGKLLKQMWAIGIRDKKLICIISKMLKAPIELPNGEIIYPTKGTPQGGVLSPLLSNIVLNELDWWVSSQWETFPSRTKYKGKVNKDGSIQQTAKYAALRRTSDMKEMYIIRYADDFKIFCKNYKDAKNIYCAITKWLKDRLSLEYSEEKSRIVNLKRNYSEYLGFKFKIMKKANKACVKSRMTEKALTRSKEKLKNQIINIQKPRTTQEYEIRIYNSIVLGIHNYFKYATLVSQDCNKIHNCTRKVFKKRKTFDNLISRKGKYLYEWVKERYGKSKCIRFINEIPVFPISYVQHKNPMYKRKDIN